METHDVIVVGGGASGLTFANFSAAAGRETLLLEQTPRMGGCLETRRLQSGFWFELGAHACYNSYGTLLEIAERCGLRDRLLPRVRVPFKLLREGKLVSATGALDWLELLGSLPRAFVTRKEGRTVYGYYSRLVGRRNYGRMLGPFLSAVPSQSADAFPASMLFKRRPRRRDFPRSFTLRDGLQSLADSMAVRPGLTTATGVEVRSVAPAGPGYAVTDAGGREYRARALALAVPPSAAAAILAAHWPELSGSLARVATVRVETLGVALPKEKLSLEPVMGIAPVDDLFFSVVTRDTVPDERFRGFAFHFKPGLPLDQRLERMAQVLAVSPGELGPVSEKAVLLPSPVLGHERIVADIDRLLAGTRLAVTGNYFAGLALEDCAGRSRQEFARIAALG